MKHIPCGKICIIHILPRRACFFYGEAITEIYISRVGGTYIVEKRFLWFITIISWDISEAFHVIELGIAFWYY